MIATVIFPHQLFEQNPAIVFDAQVYLVEEFLFFKQYNFHRQKLKYHRATMKLYEQFLSERGLKVTYVESADEISDVRELMPFLIARGFKEVHFCDVADNWLERRVKKHADEIKLVEHASPMFLNTKDELGAYFTGKKHYFQTDFYIQQRKKRRVLLDSEAKPVGGKWSFDAENRFKYPRSKQPPAVSFPSENDVHKESEDYVRANFNLNYGALRSDFIYPTTYAESRKWLTQFLESRFLDFGAYEDAIVANERILQHSVLTPMMNVGLLTPQEIIHTTLEFASTNNVPINSLEGFVRQIVGWREFIRGVYEVAGVWERTMNFWSFKRRIPESFWTGETGIEPLDSVVKKVLDTGYCHHIERLMVIGNFMLLCEFDPDEVYKWFMELFIDAYDWVMVTNVYGMSQFADGGLMATKPYISGSNYLMKMSDFSKGDWQKTWDGLFWRFIDVHRDFFLKNPRLGMLVRTFDKMPPEKRSSLFETAETYLESLDANIIGDTKKEQRKVNII